MNQYYETTKKRIEEELVKGCGFKKAEPLAAFAFLNLYCYDPDFNDYPKKLRYAGDRHFFFDILVNGLDYEKHLSKVEEVYYNPADPGDHIIISEKDMEIDVHSEIESSFRCYRYYFEDYFKEKQSKHINRVFEQLKLPREQRKDIPYE